MDSVREVVLEDLEAVRELAVESGVFSDYEVGIITEAIEDYAIEPEDDEVKTYVHATGDKVTGFIVVSKGLGNNTYEVDWICVSKKHQRNGIGRRLIEQAEKQVRENNGRMLFIETESSTGYSPARMLYERLGYTVSSIVKDYYDDGNDKIVYCKRIAGGGHSPRKTFA